MFSLPYCHRNCKMEALASQYEDLSKKKEKGQAISTTRTLLGRPEHVAEVVAAGIRRMSSRFFPTLSFFRMSSRAIFASKLSVQLLRGTENTCRYVERCGNHQTKKNVCLVWNSIKSEKRVLMIKMLPTANLRIFLHKPIAGLLTWTAFPRWWVPLDPLETCLQKTKGKVLENWSSLLEQETWRQLCVYKRKTYLLIQNDPLWESKKWSIGVCMRVIAFLAMVWDAVLL